MDLYGDLPPAADDGKETSKVGGWARSNTSLQIKRQNTPVSTTSNLTSKSVPKSGIGAGSNEIKTNQVKSVSKVPASFTFKPRQATVIHHGVSGGLTPHSETNKGADSEKLSHNPSSSPTAVENVSTFEVDDPYDPAKPNDYLAWCEERLDRKRRARLEVENRKTLEETEKMRQALEKERAEAAQKGDVDRLKELQGGAGRGRGRGLSNLPAWMTDNDSKTETKKEEVRNPYDPNPTRYEGPDDDADDNNINNTQIGSKLMSKMGYKEGSGLGRSGQGIIKPIEHKYTGSGVGIIVMDQHDRHRINNQNQINSISEPVSNSTSSSTSSSSSTTVSGKRKLGLFSNPSCVLLLKNMVGPGEVESSLGPETEVECQKYGPVRRCEVYDASIKFPNIPEDEAVRTFVAFEKQESAVRAYRDLNGRYFAGRQISASFFDEKRFDNHDFVPHPGDCFNGSIYTSYKKINQIKLYSESDNPKK